MSYNGWTNYETWNVNLWIENDEGLYRCKREHLASLENPVTGDDVKTFYSEWMEGTTPDLTELRKAGDHIDAVNYDEIASRWEDERKDMNV